MDMIRKNLKELSRIVMEDSLSHSAEYSITWGSDSGESALILAVHISSDDELVLDLNHECVRITIPCKDIIYATSSDWGSLEIRFIEQDGNISSQAPELFNWQNNYTTFHISRYILRRVFTDLWREFPSL